MRGKMRSDWLLPKKTQAGTRVFIGKTKARSSKLRKPDRLLLMCIAREEAKPKPQIWRKNRKSTRGNGNKTSP
jgi:hypothetical protein